jgi:hypothetical protein
MVKQRYLLRWLWLCASVALVLPFAELAEAKYIGGDPPKCLFCACKGCTCPSNEQPSNTSSSLSDSEGNVREIVPIASLGSVNGGLDISLTYNSYNADNSGATLDTVAGYGWTHNFNVFLFGQLGSMFRYDGDGRVTRYSLGPGGTFVTSPGYFETLKQSGTTFTLTQKDQTKYTFIPITGTPFFVGGPVYRLTQIVDRNGNTTTRA